MLITQTSLYSRPIVRVRVRVIYFIVYYHPSAESHITPRLSVVPIEFTILLIRNFCAAHITFRPVITSTHFTSTHYLYSCRSYTQNNACERAIQINVPRLWRPPLVGAYEDHRRKQFLGALETVIRVKIHDSTDSTRKGRK
jgi:hypothetical protein